MDGNELPVSTFWLVILAALLGFAAGAVRVLLARRRLRRRVVEMPNSHYTSPLVRAAEMRHRWHEMDLERIHEINRGEVIRLLGVVDAAGVEALRPDERRFMETMSELFGRAPAGERSADREHETSNRPPPPGGGGTLDPHGRSV
jgi:hypothetical protein